MELTFSTSVFAMSMRLQSRGKLEEIRCSAELASTPPTDTGGKRGGFLVGPVACRAGLFNIWEVHYYSACTDMGLESTPKDPAERNTTAFAISLKNTFPPLSWESRRVGGIAQAKADHFRVTQRLPFDRVALKLAAQTL